MYKECRFIKANGLKCQSPALRGAQFCYLHARTRVVVPRRRCFADRPLELPQLENADAIHAALGEILNALASSGISPKRAGTLLNGLQLAQKSIENRPVNATAPAPRPKSPLGYSKNFGRSADLLTRQLADSLTRQLACSGPSFPAGAPGGRFVPAGVACSLFFYVGVLSSR